MNNNPYPAYFIVIILAALANSWLRADEPKVAVSPPPDAIQDAQTQLMLLGSFVEMTFEILRQTTVTSNRKLEVTILVKRHPSGGILVALALHR